MPSVASCRMCRKEVVREGDINKPNARNLDYFAFFTLIHINNFDIEPIVKNLLSLVK